MAKNKSFMALKIVYVLVLLLRPVLMIYSRFKVGGFLENNLMEEMNVFLKKYNPVFDVFINVFLIVTIAFLIYDLFLAFNKHIFSGLTDFILYSNVILIMSMLFLIIVVPETVVNMPTIFDFCYWNILLSPAMAVLKIVISKKKN